MISSTNHEIIPVSFQASTIAYPFSPHHFSSIVFVDRLRGRHVIISRRLRLFPDDYFFLEFFVNDPFNSLPFRLLWRATKRRVFMYRVLVMRTP